MNNSTIKKKKERRHYAIRAVQQQFLFSPAIQFFDTKRNNSSGISHH